MASCSQVNSLFQAYIDEELGRSETRILEAHLHECAACRKELARQKACASEVIGALSDRRLVWGLRSRVLAHLPEMDPALQYGSHPTDPRFSSRKPRGLSPWFSVAAALFVLLGTALIYGTVHTPAALSSGRAPAPVGMVTFNDGMGLLRVEPHTGGYERVELKALVHGGELFETLGDGRLALALIGGSTVKANHNTTMTVLDNRRVTVAQGLTYFDIGRDRRHFFVETPMGEIMVFGTAFVVDVAANTTTVTVAEGVILVQNRAGKTAVSRGNQVVFTRDDLMPAPRAVDVAPIVAWADAIVPDPGAVALFMETLEAGYAIDISITAEPVYAVPNLKGRTIENVIVDWQPDGLTEGHCSYTVHVMDGNGKLRLLDSISGEVFNDPAHTQFIVPVVNAPINDVDVLHVKLIPDYTTGDVEVTIERVRVVAVQR